LAHELFGTTGRLPMVFQYDPSMYYVETVDGELVVTVTRTLLSPRVRYAVHDAGGTIGYAEAIAFARAHGVDLPVHGSPRAPFLFVAGRVDSTVSHMGANLYPEDVDAALGALQEQHPHWGLGSFCIELHEAADGSTVPLIHVEADGAAVDDIRDGIADWLVGHNRDWAAAASEDPSAPYFAIRIAAHGTGVFTANATRIKRRYVLEAA
jgi:phenylacetate-CoA ligase